MDAAQWTPGLRALGEFLARYSVYFAILIFAIVSNVVRFRRWRRTSHALLKSALAAEWSDPRIEPLSGGVRGVWQGRPATLRSLNSRNANLIKATLGTSTAGRFLIERASSNFLTRQIHVGGPPRVEPRDPTDQVFSVRSTDRTLTDRLLADPTARAAISAAVMQPDDRVSLEGDRFVARRSYPRSDALDPAAAACLTAVREMARVLG
jgi:hypothetical protein